MKIARNQILEREAEKPILYDFLYNDENLKAGKLIVFCHGFKGYKDWGHWEMLCKEMVKAGYLVLKFNFSHNGGIMKNPIDFPDLEAFSENNHTIEVEDLTDVIDFVFSDLTVQMEFTVSQLTVIGHSRGGGVVLIKAAEDRRINKVITWASVDDYGKRYLAYNMKQWKEEGITTVRNGRTKQDMPLKYQFYEDYLKNKERLNIHKKAQTITVPVLVCHGTDDEAVGVSAARRLDAMLPNGHLELIENAGHTFGGKHPWADKELPKESKDLLKVTIDFIDNN